MQGSFKEVQGSFKEVQGSFEDVKGSFDVRTPSWCSALQGVAVCCRVSQRSFADV